MTVITTCTHVRNYDSILEAKPMLVHGRYVAGVDADVPYELSHPTSFRLGYIQGSLQAMLALEYCVD